MEPWWFARYGDAPACPLCAAPRHVAPLIVTRITIPRRGDRRIFDITCYGDADPPGWRGLAYPRQRLLTIGRTKNEPVTRRDRRPQPRRR
jgi:hypothetical protein